MHQARKLLKCTLLFAFFAVQCIWLKADVVYAIPLKGQEHQIGNLLNWRTSTEFNSQVFIIERSMDGVDYEAIGEVDAAGMSDAENGYRFLDVGVVENKSYYRLRQVDMDGTSSFSQTILLKKQLTNHFMVLSMSNTSTTSTFSMSVDAIVEGEIYYALKTLNGDIIHEAKQELYFGLNEINLDLKDEAEGTYYVVLKVAEEKEKLVVRKIDGEEAKKENVASKKQENGG